MGRPGQGGRQAGKKAGRKAGRQEGRKAGREGGRQIRLYVFVNGRILYGSCAHESMWTYVHACACGHVRLFDPRFKLALRDASVPPHLLFAAAASAEELGRAAAVSLSQTGLAPLIRGAWTKVARRWGGGE